MKFFHFIKSKKVWLLAAVIVLIYALNGLIIWRSYFYHPELRPVFPSPSAVAVVSPSPTLVPSPTPRPEVTSTPTEEIPPEATPEPTPTPEPPAETNTSGITIRGDETCQNQTTSALNQLKAAPAEYSVATEYIGIIECVEAGSGIAVAEEPPRYQVGAVTRNAGTTWYASTIAHDACHSQQFHQNRASNGENAEAECLALQKDALEKMGAPQSMIDHIQNVINTDYWEVPAGERWW